MIFATIKLIQKLTVLTYGLFRVDGHTFDCVSCVCVERCQTRLHYFAFGSLYICRGSVCLCQPWFLSLGNWEGDTR